MSGSQSLKLKRISQLSNANLNVSLNKREAILHHHESVRFTFEYSSVPKGPVKLIHWVKIALLFLHVTSKLFHFTVLSLLDSSTLACQRSFQNDLLTIAK